MGKQPSNLESILVKVQILYDLIVNSQVVDNRGHGFSKRFNPAGVYYFTKLYTLKKAYNFTHQYRPAPCLIMPDRTLVLGGWKSGRGYNLWLA